MIDRPSDSSLPIRTPEQQESSREQLQSDIEAFLAKGGTITTHDTDTESDRVYSRSQRDSRRSRDRMRLRRINFSMLKEYREKMKTEPGYLLSRKEFSDLMGISESSVKNWKGPHPINMDDIPRPVLEDPDLWQLKEFINWHDQLKEKSRIE